MRFAVDILQECTYIRVGNILGHGRHAWDSGTAVMARIFTWDPRKATSNFRKHGLSFEEGAKTFDDDKGKDDIDDDAVGEIRWKKTAKIGRLVVIVIYAEWEEGEDEIVRIISARLASRSERRDYERNT